MLELRRGRTRTRDYAGVNHETQHEIEIDVLGISGFSVNMSVLNAPSESQRLASPDKMKAVIAVFSEGEFCASTGLSNYLRKVSKQKSKKESGSDGEEYIALWNKQSRAAKVKFDVGDCDGNEQQEAFEVWVALTDGKGQNKTCVSYPIGYGVLPFNTAVESEKAILLDLPVVGTSGQNDGYSEATDAGDQDEMKRKQAAVGSVYRFNNGDGAMVRLKLQCKKKRVRKDQTKMSSIISTISKFRQDVPQHHASGENEQMMDDEGSKRFRPIETSSLRSDSAFTLGGVAANRPSQYDGSESMLPSMDFTPHFETAFASVPNETAGYKTSKTSLSGPQSAFKPLGNSAFLSNPNIKAPIAVKPTTPATYSTASLTKTPSGTDPLEGPLDMGVLNPNTEEPSELGESRARNRRMRRAKKNALANSGGLNYEAADANPLNQESPDRKSHRVPGEIRADFKAGSSLVRESDDNSLASVKTVLSTARNGPFDLSCGAFGTLQVFPNGVLWHFKGQKQNTPPTYEDDMSLSTIRTKNSSQIVPWKESMRTAYAAETGTVAGDDKCGSTANIGMGQFLEKMFRQMGWEGKS